LTKEKKRRLKILRSLFSRLLLLPTLILVLASFFAGIIFWGGFNTALEVTNTETFCISCHEMRDTVYKEYKNTLHYSNRTGVRATCPDCHVPKDWVHKVVRKIGASNELYHHFIGSIDTPEKFSAKRLELARHVWLGMKQTDSRECRNCHDFTSMDTTMQRDVAGEKHRLANSRGETCIDCHKGIAHKLPEEFIEQEHLRFEREKVACYECHENMARPDADDDWY
jgi:cytochrome c-type protein NapC